MKVAMRLFQYLIILLVFGTGFFLMGNIFSRQKKADVKIKNEVIHALVSATNSQWARGLRGVKYLAPQEGMLFIFKHPAQYRFYMKDTFIPLSIAFINQRREIIGIEAMKPLSKKFHISPEPISYALEVNQGWFSQHNINVGDKIEIVKSR